MQENYQQNRSGRGLSTIFAGGVSMSSLKIKRVVNYPQLERISKNLRQEVKRAAEFKIFPNWHVFVSIFGR